ncbi:hypothetical protein BO71DRAFT_423415 [Aspergillus ellipticus CBS 707.79]|uniref:Uncharacterized protein n=1 Tax=Aspergillus ellipticus CBS 707.79 TaxID=1448320 RepID=A0A319CW42_9EURO|nr:hypothetical protein BO71DRAFT_423415 [Aspergillus ellipticus CBS 707.79]
MHDHQATLLDILTSILPDPLLPPTHLIIDALDECITGLSDLLDFIVDKSESHPNVKWLVSSRNWPSIENSLETVSRKEKLWLELDDASISKAIVAFIHHRVRILTTKKKYSQHTQDAMSQYLLTNAQGTFLWVALVCDQLSKPKVSRLYAREEVKRFPAGLVQLYWRMFDQISDTNDAELCKSILGISATVYRPLTLDELWSYIDLPQDAERSDLEEIIGLCGSLVTLRGSTISLVHQSARDFLHREAISKIFPEGEGVVHHSIFSISMDVMARTLRRDIYNLVHPGYPIDRVQHPDPDPLATIHYACLYWVDHLQRYTQQVGKNMHDFEEGGPVGVFFRKNHLHWLEAMSLLRKLSEGITSMLKLKSLIESEKQHMPMMDRVHDACQFAEQPSWLIGKPEMEDQWTPCLQNLEGHREFINSVCFSHDSKMLASGSNDYIVKIWDTDSGQCRRTLYGQNEKVLSVSFSPDSKLLALASMGCTIKVWDTITGQNIQTFQGSGDGDSISATVTFSHDSKLLISSFVREVIEIWGTDHWQCLRSLISHRYHRSFTLSHNSKFWDTNTGECLQTLEKHEWPVYSVALSHDSQLLASASVDSTIHLWETGSWKYLRTLNGHREGVKSVRFSSHDSKFLASGSTDQTIKLWDTNNGQCLQTFQENCWNIDSIALSHDSKLLAATDYDSIRIWDTTSRHHPSEFNRHAEPTIKAVPSKILSLMFSHDLRLLASHCDDHSVQVWDISSGRCTQMFTKALHMKNFFLVNPSVQLYDGTVGFSRFPIDGPDSDTPTAESPSQGHGVDFDGSYITWNSECLLWLTPEYRPYIFSTFVISQSTVCIGCNSGRVLFFTFDTARLLEALQTP